MKKLSWTDWETPSRLTVFHSARGDQEGYGGEGSPIFLLGSGPFLFKNLHARQGLPRYPIVAWLCWARPAFRLDLSPTPKKEFTSRQEKKKSCHSGGKNSIILIDGYEFCLSIFPLITCAYVLNLFIECIVLVYTLLSIFESIFIRTVDLQFFSLFEITSLPDFALE